MYLAPCRSHVSLSRTAASHVALQRAINEAYSRAVPCTCFLRLQNGTHVCFLIFQQCKAYAEGMASQDGVVCSSPAINGHLDLQYLQGGQLAERWRQAGPCIVGCQDQLFQICQAEDGWQPHIDPGHQSYHRLVVSCNTDILMIRSFSHRIQRALNKIHTQRGAMQALACLCRRPS